MDKLASSRSVAKLFAFALCCTLSVGLLQGADGVMQPGENVEGNLAPEGARDTWTVQLNDEQGLVVRRYISLVTDGFEPVLEFLDEQGEPFSTIRADDDDKRRLWFNWSWGGSGPYQIRVSSRDWSEGGRYFLRVFHAGTSFVIPPGDEGGVLEESGRKIPGVLEGGDIDIFRVTYDATRSQMVSVVSEGRDMKVQVARRGDVRAENLSALADAPFWYEVENPHDSSPQYQRYDIVLYNPNVDLAEEYAIVLYKVPGDFIVEPGDEGGALASGMTHYGHVSTSDMDVWSFQLKPDVPVVVAMGANNFRPTVAFSSDSLSGPTYSWPVHGANFQDPVNVSYALFPKSFYAPGLVNMSIGGPNTSESASEYRIDYFEIGEPFDVAEGDEGGWIPESGVIGGELPFGDLDLWTFYANQGTTVRFEPEELEDVAFRPGMLVFDPLGTPSEGHLMVSPSPLLYEVHNSGIHTLIVFARSGMAGGVSGPYVINVEGLTLQAPALRPTRMESTSLRLNWPSQLGAAVLQQNEGLHPEGWKDVLLPVNAGGLNSHVIIPVGEDSMFFRLLPEAPPGP